MDFYVNASIVRRQSTIELAQTIINVTTVRPDSDSLLPSVEVEPNLGISRSVDSGDRLSRQVSASAQRYLVLLLNVLAEICCGKRSVNQLPKNIAAIKLKTIIEKLGNQPRFKIAAIQQPNPSTVEACVAVKSGGVLMIKLERTANEWLCALIDLL